MSNTFNLPDELIEEIITSLPRKFFLRCTLLSKAWLERLISPDVIENFLFKNSQKPQLLFIQAIDTGVTAADCLKEPAHPISIWSVAYENIEGSAQGVVLLVNLDCIISPGNPYTRERGPIPNPPSWPVIVGSSSIGVSYGLVAGEANNSHVKVILITNMLLT